MAATITTRAAGHLITAQRVVTTGRWEVIIDGHLGFNESAYALRSIYASDDAATALSAAITDAVVHEDNRSPYTGHTLDCQAQASLDESDCDC